MGEYDHICKHSGAANYPQWCQQMTLSLKGERLWNHCSSSSDPKDFAEYSLTLPVPADPNAITTAEREKILDWLAKDAQVKALIDRKISMVVTSQLSNSQSAREQWSILS